MARVARAQVREKARSVRALPDPGSARNWHRAGVALVLAVIALSFATYSQYGITWDAEHSAANGEYFLRWYSSGFQDMAIINDNNQRLYGSFFNGLSRLLAPQIPDILLVAGHLVIGLTACLGLAYVYRLGALMLGPRAGFFSALALLLTPPWFGHSFNNPKDVPFGVFFVIALYYLMRGYRSFPRWNRSEMAKAGVAIGLALGIRVAAVILFGYYFVLFGFWALARWRQRGKPAIRALKSDTLAASFNFLPILACAWAVMVVLWPYAQLSPIANPIAAIRANANFTDWPFIVLYGGEFILAPQLPWHYLPTWFAITTPEFHAIIWVAALTTVGWISYSKPKRALPPDYDLQSQIGFLAFTAIFPIATAILMKSIVYDGNRHFLFVIPSLCVITGCALSWVLERSIADWARTLTIGLAGFCALWVAVDMFAMHPFQSSYFNRAFGGIRAAYGYYEVDYLASSHKEAVDWLVENYRPDAPDRSIRVANMSNPAQSYHYILSGGPKTQRFYPVNFDDSPDIMLATGRWNRHKEVRGTVVHQVERMGVPLLYVIEIDKGAR